MDKNLLLAVVLSSIVIMASYLIFPPPTPELEKTSQTTSEASSETGSTLKTDGLNSGTNSSGSTSVPLDTVAQDEFAAERKKIQVETPLYIAEIDTKDGVLSSFLLKKYHYAMPQHFNIKSWVISLFTGGEEYYVPEVDPDRLLNMVGEFSLRNQPWRFFAEKGQGALLYQTSVDQINLVEGDSGKQLTLTSYLSSGLRITKSITFHADSYIMDLDVKVDNPTANAQGIDPRIEFGSGNELSPFGYIAEPKSGVSYIDGDPENYTDSDFEKGSLRVNNAAWFGISDTHFLSVVKISGKGERILGMLENETLLEKVQNWIPTYSFQDGSQILQSGQIYQKEFSLFMGPKDLGEMEKFDKTLPENANLWMNFLAQPLMVVLRWLYSYVGNWGIAIIILTLIVRTLLFPLAYRGMLSMRRMSKLTPRMQKLREKYKDDKETLNREMMELYRKNGVNPVGGCLPMVMQIPIFIALYSALRPAIELRHSPFFFWVDDLSAGDHTLILPIMMGVLMFLQQQLTPTSAAMDPTQQKMMKWFPVIMTFFFLDFPTGLVLYWVVSNAFSIIQQVVINRAKIDDFPEVEEPKSLKGSKGASSKGKKGSNTPKKKAK